MEFLFWVNCALLRLACLEYGRSCETCSVEQFASDKDFSTMRRVGQVGQHGAGACRAKRRVDEVAIHGVYLG